LNEIFDFFQLNKQIVGNNPHKEKEEDDESGSSS
jgi:hypothetical protein